MEDRKAKVPKIIAEWFEEHNHYGGCRYDPISTRC